MHPYEIHVTIHNNDRPLLEEKAIMGKLPEGLKILRIENYNITGNSYPETVTKHVERGEDAFAVILKANKFKEQVRDWAIRVKRVKVEVPPYHPWVAEKRGLYFEAHMRSGSILMGDARELGMFASVLRGKTGAYYTMRERDDTFEDFNERLQLRLKHLANRGQVPERSPEVEYCIYDDNEQLDNMWMK